jgi:hypothetical protein
MTLNRGTRNALFGTGIALGWTLIVIGIAKWMAA